MLNMVQKNQHFLGMVEHWLRLEMPILDDDAMSKQYLLKAQRIINKNIDHVIAGIAMGGNNA